jgi:hypothetical protein
MNVPIAGHFKAIAPAAAGVEKTDRPIWMTERRPTVGDLEASRRSYEHMFAYVPDGVGRHPAGMSTDQSGWAWVVVELGEIVPTPSRSSPISCSSTAFR